MRLPSLGYPVTRPFTLPHFTLIVIGFGIVWTVLITILNVAAVGYDLVPIYSTSFNSSTSTLFWYEKFAPIRWLFPPSWICDAAVIQHGQRTTLTFHFLQ